MTIPELGTLVSVDLREAWSHEAHSFTPWMAKNLSTLSDVIGIPLELEGREVKVDRFSADILARCPSDDSLVLIENQLEVTDHTHLGQILTYLAGLDAQTVIWVAQSFTDPHLSAVKWLNEHTVEPFSFFAVRVRIVRIGESPMAPVFEVLERPNEWDRRLQTIAREAHEISEIGQYRRDFWAHYAARFPGDGDLRPGYAASSLPFDVPEIDVRIVVYLGKGEVGIFLRGERGESNEDVFMRLNELDQTCWNQLDVDLKESSKGHYAGKSILIDGSDRNNWNRMADWLHEQVELYRSVLLKTTLADTT